MELLILSLVVCYLSSAWAQQDGVPISVSSGFVPAPQVSVVTVAPATTTKSVLMVDPMDIFAGGKPLTQCGANVACGPKNITTTISNFPSTQWVTSTYTTIANETIFEEHTMSVISVQSDVIASEGICSKVVIATFDQPIISTLNQTTTSTDYYLVRTTVTVTDIITANVTAQLPCTIPVSPSLSGPGPVITAPGQADSDKAQSVVAA